MKNIRISVNTSPVLVNSQNNANNILVNSANGIQGARGGQGEQGTSGSPIPRVLSVTTTNSMTPDMDSYDMISISNLSEAITFSNPIGTLQNGRKLIIRIRDSGEAYDLNWDSAYVNGGQALPTTTTPLKNKTLGFLYNTDNDLNSWMLIASVTES